MEEDYAIRDRMRAHPIKGGTVFQGIVIKFSPPISNKLFELEFVKEIKVTDSRSDGKLVYIQEIQLQDENGNIEKVEHITINADLLEFIQKDTYIKFMIPDDSPQRSITVIACKKYDELQVRQAPNKYRKYSTWITFSILTILYFPIFYVSTYTYLPTLLTGRDFETIRAILTMFVLVLFPLIYNPIFFFLATIIYTSILTAKMYNNFYFKKEDKISDLYFHLFMYKNRNF